MKYGVIIVAGGQGERMGSILPKQFIPIHGKPILMHTLELFHSWNTAATLILVLPKSHQDYWKMLVRELNCEIPHQIVDGGETRFHSVRNGLMQLTNCELVGVHDGVRPLVSCEVIDNCFKKAAETGAVIPVIPLTETIRKRDGEYSYSVNRAEYVNVQTPQVFRYDWLVEAYRQNYIPGFTDDASVIENNGKTIYLVEGNTENIKITNPIDLIIAEKLLS
ncbi:MAG: 2-C-methyl-D-erythritol 4-phosphate cytidylyltransferase [Tannerella sp.]|jgi:2-C-methyl-D-erythritol 4-phosphate cytidylyltransferase|nr:2-C-methyl-D-erythritol 4-phosphate cytidylyltransferase [Tannerella sp.]